jgi:PDZ domain-containing protein
VDLTKEYPTTLEELELPPARLPRWPAFVLVGFVLAGAILVGLWQVSLPYFALSPGPVSDVEDLIEVTDQPVFLPDGDMYMLTVSLQEVNVFEYAQAYFDPSIDLVAREVIRPADVSPDEFRRANRDAMDDSKNTAISVALQYLGYDVHDAGEGVLVSGVLEGTPADGVLQTGDVITAVGGVPVTIRDDGINEIVSHDIGETVTLTVQRGDQTLELDVTLVEHTQEPGRPMVGFQADTYNRTLVFPFEVEIDSQNVGGPSAGMMYTLTIIDLLTEGDMTGGNVIAGTGTIDSDGTVGPIGGVRQKVVAAQAAGARYILVPEANYADALTMKDDGVEIFSIRTLDDAVQVLQGLPAA